MEGESFFFFFLTCRVFSAVDLSRAAARLSTPGEMFLPLIDVDRFVSHTHAALTVMSVTLPEPCRACSRGVLCLSKTSKHEGRGVDNTV